MTRTTGTLHISAGISRLDATRLIKDTNNDNGLGTATTFLRFNRQLHDNDDIFVDGDEVNFKNTSEVVILITDAGRSTEAVAANVLESLSAKSTTKKAAKKATGKRAAKKPSKKAGTKKAAKKAAGKKSGKKAGAKKTSKKGVTRKAAKRSRRNQTAAKKGTGKTRSRKK